MKRHYSSKAKPIFLFVFFSFFITISTIAATGISCLTEDFESVIKVSSATGAADNYMQTGSDQNKTLVINSGTWTLAQVRLDQSNYRSTTNAIRFGDAGASSYVITPVLDNPQSIIFYIKAGSSNPGILYGFTVSVGGTFITSAYIDDVSTTANANSGYTFSDNSTWHKVEVYINSTTQIQVKIAGTTANSKDRYYIDDVNVICSSSLLTAKPNVGGLTYVNGLGPSATRTFAITGTDLPQSSGTITLSNLGNFEVSLDGGLSWVSGSTSFTYSGSTSLSKACLVRLKAGLAAGSYTTTVTVNGGGYTKTPPTITFSGSVTTVPSTEQCGDEITLLNLNGTGATLNLVDAVTGTSWISSDAAQADSHIKLMSTLVSPTISLDQYDLKELTFYYQPYGGTGRDLRMSYSMNGGSTYTGDTLLLGPAKVPYYVTYDLSNRGITDYFSLKFAINATSKYLELWNIKVTGTPKKIIETTTPVLSGFKSYVNCPSDVQSLIITGKCLVDNGTLNFTSTYYEFSADSATWGNSISYTGVFPTLGLKVYVRQKGATAGGISVNEQVKVTNGAYGGNYTLYLSGTIEALDIASPTEGQIFNFTTTAGVSATKLIPIDAEVFCSPLVASTSCGGLTLSTCETGTYASSVTFGATAMVKKLYLKFTPGTLSNCTVTLTSGALTRTIYINWNGVSSSTNAIEVESPSVTVPISSYGTINVTSKSTLPSSTTVTIASSAGLSSVFDFSLGNPNYSDFVATTNYPLGDFEGTLYIKPKSGATVGTTETITVSAPGATSAVFTVKVVN